MWNQTLLFCLAFAFIKFSVISAQSDMKLNDFSQGFVLTGRIVDKETNLGVPFAYVMIYKTDKGTLSDSLGNFRLDIPSVFSTHQLLISSVGFRDTIVAMPTNMSEIKIIPNLRVLKYSVCILLRRENAFLLRIAGNEIRMNYGKMIRFLLNVLSLHNKIR